MKYRIIGQLDKDGNQFYLVQHYDKKYLNWVTTQKFEASQSLLSNWGDMKFKTIKEAKKFIKKTAEKEKNLNTPATVVYEEVI